ncbi:unnamed protein product [Parnassius apollo]|uniref:(apollo) hypothetical protein n=1 Tax=Parnassius apollo TaxID=110799 RepID=A0A8S3YB04_PARAO|nr:unnamed protein product [Parnassius apollo]
MRRKPMKYILNLAKLSTPTDPVTPMQDPVISTNPVVIKKRAEMFLGGVLADKKKTKSILREEYEYADLER